MSDLDPNCAQKRTSASATGTLRKLMEMTDPDPSTFANCHVIVCYGSYRQFLVTAGPVRRRRLRADGRSAWR